MQHALDAVVLCDDGPNFLSLCRFESSHVFVETHLEREREREQKKKRCKASTS
jgi:hypothetical protein